VSHVGALLEGRTFYAALLESEGAVAEGMLQFPWLPTLYYGAMEVRSPLKGSTEAPYAHHHSPNERVTFKVLW
jgi:hypothetical protein